MQANRDIYGGRFENELTTCLFRVAQCPAVRPRITFLFRLAAANHRLVGAYCRLVGANHRLAGANEARPFAPRRARPIPARRVQVLQSTYEAHGISSQLLAPLGPVGCSKSA